MAGPASILTIEELTGQKRRLDLFGAGLPLRGAKWGGELVMSTHWLPGNKREATQHVLAPTDVPSDMNGKWNTTRLVSTPAKYSTGPGVPAVPVALAHSLMEVAEGIFSSGQRLRVTWFQGTSSTNFKMVREGLCKHWEWEVERADDINWSWNFEWAGRGPAKQRTVDLKGDTTASSLKKANQMLADFTSEQEANAIISAQQNIPMSADSFSLGQLEAIANIPKDFAKQLQQYATLVTSRIDKVAQIIQAGASTPALVASTVLDIATNATTSFAQTADAMGRVVPDAYSNVDGDAAAMIRASDYFAGQQEGAEGILGAMAQIREEARRRASATKTAEGGATPEGILAVVLAHGLETFISLSVTYYGNPDLGGIIAIANGFAEYEVAPPAGTTLIIPKVNRADLDQQL